MGLKWAINAHNKSEGTSASALRSFLEWHQSADTVKNDFYISPLADHTLAVRIGTLTDAILRELVPQDLLAATIDEIRKSIDAATSERIYRPNSNHGLQIDLAIVRSAFELDQLSDLRSMAASRIENIKHQCAHIFAPDGFNREHSTSYQDYNVFVLCRAVDQIPIHERTEPLIHFLKDLIHRTAEACAWTLIDGNRITNLGDSFRTIPDRRVNTISRQSDGRLRDWVDGLKPLPLGQKLFNASGFFFSRERSKFGIEHLSVTAACHSGVHNQADDGAFTFYINGECVFDDPGFHDAHKGDRQLFSEVKGHTHHNVFHSESLPLSSLSYRREATSIDTSTTAEGVIKIAISTGLFGRKTAKRTISYGVGDFLKVSDSAPFDGYQTFLLGPNVSAEILGEAVELRIPTIRLGASIKSTPGSIYKIHKVRVIQDEQLIEQQLVTVSHEGASLDTAIVYYELK